MVLILGLCLAGAWRAWAGGAASAPSDSWRPAWSSLRFEASSFLANVSLDFEIQPGPPGAASGGSGAVWLAIIRTRMDSTVLARKSSEIQARFDPGTGSVAGYSKLALGPSPDRKIYEFSPEGAHRTRIEPLPGESRDRPESWSAVRKSFHPFEARALGCQLLSEPSVLVYEIVSGGLSASSRAGGICVFSGKTLFRLDLQNLGSRTLAVDYDIGSRASVQRRTASVAAQCYRVVGRPIAGENDEEDIDVGFCVDPALHLPVELTSGIGPLGTLSMRLARVVAPHAPASS